MKYGSGRLPIDESRRLLVTYGVFFTPREWMLRYSVRPLAFREWRTISLESSGSNPPISKRTCVFSPEKDKVETSHTS